MSNPDKTIDPRLLEAAKHEFLNKGFMNASIRTICTDAGVTTGAFYKRYKTKEALFNTLVSPTIDELLGMLGRIEKDEIKGLEENEDLDVIWDNPNDDLKRFINYIYDHYDVFRLVFCSSEGTSYSNFVHELVELACKGTMTVMGKAYKKKLIAYMPEEEELHILLTAYYDAVIEAVRHNLPKDKALNYCDSLKRLFNWKGFFGC